MQVQKPNTSTPSIASLMASTTSVPQKRKDPPPSSSPARQRADPTERDSPKSETDTTTRQSTSPTDEYASGRIVCETCGGAISIRDEATGGFTVKHWEAHRSTCQTASQGTTQLAASEPPTAQPDTPQPQAKRRRAKRTEEERIDYLRSDQYVAKFEAYRVLCASCDKWIRLRPNSTYCSIPWDAHRKSCLAKRAAKNTHPADDRSAAFAMDPKVKRSEDDNAAAIQTWKQHRDSCHPQAVASPNSSTSKFNIANVPPPPKHLLALASSSSLPPPSASARTAVAHSMSATPVSASQSSSSSSAAMFTAPFKDYHPHNFAGVHESRRRSADQRAAALRADPLLGEVEPGRVFCKMCRKWVQLRQDSTYCAYPWQQHKVKCLKRHQKISDRDAEIAELRATRDAALEGELDVSETSGSPEQEDEDEADAAEHERQKAARRRAKVLAKAEAATARLRQLEEVRPGPEHAGGSPPSTEEDEDAEGDYMDVDTVTSAIARATLSDLDSPAGRLEFVSRSIRHLFRATYARTDELTIAALVTYLNAAMPPDKHEDFDTAEVTKSMSALHERGAYVFEGDVIRIPE